MKNTSVKFIRAKETQFLNVDVVIWDKLSPFALKVYGQLRKLVSFTAETDEAEITIECLANRSGISQRQVYNVLNELEYEHFIIQRLNKHHFRYGQTNSFAVSQTYGFFNTVQNLTTPAQNDMGVQNESISVKKRNKKTVQIFTTPAPGAVATAQNDILSTQQLSQQKDLSTTTVYAEPELNEIDCSSSSFFTSTQKTNFLKHKLKTDERTDDLFLQHCEHHITSNSHIKYGKLQKIAGLIKILIGVAYHSEHFESMRFDIPDIEKNKKSERIIKQIEDAQNKAYERKFNEMEEVVRKRKDNKNNSVSLELSH